MHARELVELAAMVSFHGPVLVHGDEPIPEAAMNRYWTASKSRLDRWGRELKRITAATASAGPHPCPGQPSQVCGVLEEILTSEVLTRVWTAVICAHDRHGNTDLMEPLARSVLTGHLEARHRVLTLLVRAPGIDTEEAFQLDRLRRRTERWTDMLLGYLAELEEVGPLAIDPQRARDFAEDFRWQRGRPGSPQVWSLLMASLRAAFGQGLAPVSPNAELNGKIAESVLRCFRPELFDAPGVFPSAWTMRISQVAGRAQGMIDELLAL